jgi:hypothetical protein
MDEKKESGRTYDYSDRSGFPGGVDSARGAAADFMAPDDMLPPKPMRPKAVKPKAERKPDSR